jgi:hypothetical protein
MVLQRRAAAEMFVGSVVYVYELREGAGGPLVLGTSPSSFNALLQSGAYRAAAHRLTRPIPAIVHVDGADKERQGGEADPAGDKGFSLQLLIPCADDEAPEPIEFTVEVTEV